MFASILSDIFSFDCTYVLIALFALFCYSLYSAAKVAGKVASGVIDATTSVVEGAADLVDQALKNEDVREAGKEIATDTAFSWLEWWLKGK